MAKFHELKYHEDEFPEKRKLTEEDIKFLINLQKEMNTQDHIGEADPRFWMIRETERIYNVDSDADGFEIYNEGSCNSYSEDEFYDYLGDTILPELYPEEDGYTYTIFQNEDNDIELTIYLNGEPEESLDSTPDIIEHLNDNGYEFKICWYREISVLNGNGFFLTHKDAQEYLKHKAHHYSDDAHTYALTAFSPEVEKLYDILHKVDFESLLNKEGNEERPDDNTCRMNHTPEDILQPCEDKIRYVSKSELNNLCKDFKKYVDKLGIPTDELAMLHNYIDNIYDLYSQAEDIPHIQTREDAVSRDKVNDLITELARAISDERMKISRGRSSATIMRDILHLPPASSQIQPCENVVIEKAVLNEAFKKIKEKIENLVPWDECLVEIGDVEEIIDKHKEELLQLCEDAVSRKAVINIVKSMSNANPSYTHTCDVVDRQDLIDSIDELASVIPQSCEDAVSRKAMIDSLKGIEALFNNDELRTAILTTIRSLPSVQPCREVVSREAVSNYINNKLTAIEEMASAATNEGRWREEEKYLYGVEILEDIDEYIKDMPFIEPTSEELVEAYNLGYNIGIKEQSKAKAEICEDAVSRRAVMEIVTKEFVDLQDGTEEWRNAVNDIVEEILHNVETMPPVTPQTTCEDAISRKAVLNEIMARIEYLHDVKDIKDHVREVIETEPPVILQSENKWILYSERLPENSGHYLVSTISNSVCEDYFGNFKGEREWANSIDKEVVAWMPLPKPYRNGGQKHE